MIRHHDSNLAAVDAVDYFHRNANPVVEWLASVSRAAMGVEIVSVAQAAVERRMGRSLVQAELLALAWTVNVLFDLTTEWQRHVEDGRFRDEAVKSAYQNAVGVAQASAMRRFTGLHPHACAQVPVILRHLHEEHF